MNQKQTLAVAAIVIGAILIVFSARGMHKAKEAKSSIDHVTDFFTNSTGIWNPVIKFFGGEAHEEASKHDTILIILMTMGIVVVISGIWGVFHYRNRSS